MHIVKEIGASRYLWHLRAISNFSSIFGPELSKRAALFAAGCMRGNECPAISFGGPVNGGETRAGVHVGPTRPSASTDRCLLMEIRPLVTERRCFIAPHRAMDRYGNLWLSKRNYRWLSLKTRLIELIWGSDRDGGGIPISGLRVSAPPWILSNFAR